MRKAIHVSIPKPCHEDWNSMSPQDQGRHCNVCEKTVFNFTDKTDEYIVKNLQQSNTICGRFKNTQLDRELAYRRKDKNNYFSYVASSLFVFLAMGTHHSFAQGEPKPSIKTEIVPNQVKGKAAHSVLKEKLISGTIYSADNYRLSYAKISIHNTNIYTKTDIGGNFKIKAKKNDFLIIESDGYESTTIEITEIKKYKIILKESFTYEKTAVDNLDLVYSERMPICGMKKYRIAIPNLEESPTIATKLKKTEKDKARKARRNGVIERTKIGKLLYAMTNIFRRRKQPLKK